MDRDMEWRSRLSLNAVAYVCGYCGHEVGPDTGYNTANRSGHRIFICTYCRRPTYGQRSISPSRPAHT